MNRENGKDPLPNDKHDVDEFYVKLNEIERAVSLCTVCQLETGCDVYQRSSSFSSTVTLIGDTNCNDSVKHDELNLAHDDNSKLTNNFLSKFDNRAIVVTNRRSFVEKEFKFFNSKIYNQPKNNKAYKLTPIFEDDNDDTELSRSYLDLLDRFNTQDSNKQSVAEYLEDDNRDRSQQLIDYSGTDTLSLEIGIAPKISENIIPRVVNDTNGNFKDSPKNVEQSSKIGKCKAEISTCKEKTDDNTNNVENNENPVSVKMPMLEPVRCYDSAILDDEIPRKKGKFGVIENHTSGLSMKITLKRDENNDPIESIANIPRKKPKIIANEILKFPIRQILLDKDKCSSTDDSKDVKINKNDLIGTRDLPTDTISLKISNVRLESKNDCTLEKVDNQQQFIRNDDNRASREAKESNCQDGKIEKEEDGKNGDSKKASSTMTTPINRRVPPKYPSMHQKVKVRRSEVTLTMLQRHMAKNSKHLIDQANEMRELSSFIDELKRSFSRKDTDIASAAKMAKKAKKHVVSRSTQTAEPYAIIPNNSTTKVPPVVNIEAPKFTSEIIRKNIPESGIQRPVFERYWFRPTVTKAQNDINREIVKNNDEMRSQTHFPLSSRDHVEIQTSKTAKTVETNQQKINLPKQYDPYYNPLRPRRWPKNRNNPKPVRNNHSGQLLNNFPPLSVIVETPKLKKGQDNPPP